MEDTPQSPEPWSEKTNKGCSGCFMAFMVVFICLYIVGFFLGPINPGVHKARESASVQTAHLLGLCLYSYANDHQGLYPDGTSSTEVFQQLLDGGYVTDPAVFYVEMDGKTRASTGHKLKPENVCWDVTGGVSVKDDGQLPLVYLTGFRVTFAPGGGITPLEPFPPYVHFKKNDGLAVFYVNNSAAWLWGGDSPQMQHIFPPDFNAHGKTYRQLTPDGVLR